MTRVLVTGMSGTGKSTVITELKARGYRAVDADGERLSEVVDVDPDELTGLGRGRDWVWHEDRIQEVLDFDEGDVLFVGGWRTLHARAQPDPARLCVSIGAVLWPVYVATALDVAVGSLEEPRSLSIRMLRFLPLLALAGYLSAPAGLRSLAR